jgi:hypothetical protein
MSSNVCEEGSGFVGEMTFEGDHAIFGRGYRIYGILVWADAS